jgi:hypothetical protein
MSDSSSFPERLQKVFQAPTGVVGLVDDLLLLCRDQELRFDWDADRCAVRALGTDSRESTDIPLRKADFRTILARLAVLRHERVPNSVSPYGGNGELSLACDPSTVFQVAFVNTPAEQRLEVRPRREHTDG